MTDYSLLLERAEHIGLSDYQRETLRVLVEAGSQRLAAGQLGISLRSMERRVRTIRKHAARAGVAPDAQLPGPGAPVGFEVGKISAFRKVDPETGEVKTPHWWEISHRSMREVAEQLHSLVDTLCERLADEAPAPRPAPRVSAPDLMNLLPIGDHHKGMYAWSEETGSDNYDLKTAASWLQTAMRYAIDTAPTASVALIAPLGDFFHYETKDTRSLNSGHSYDADGRYSKMIDVGVDSLVYCIDYALEHHAEVWVVCVLGNHDWHPSLALEKILRAYYRREPRMRLLEGHGSMYHVVPWGEVLHGFHHGHHRDVRSLAGVMPRLYREQWGAARYHYWHTGHVHRDHTTVLGDGSYARSYGVLPPYDAYNAAMAHVHGPRCIQRLTYHRRWGELSTGRGPIELIQQLAG